MSILHIQQYSPGSYYYNFKNKLAKHVFDRSEECFKKAEENRNNIKTKEDFEKYTCDMRTRFIESMGGIPYDNSLPLKATTTGVIEEEDLTIEKVIYQSREGVYVTANLYIPKKRKDPCGAVLFQCGHSLQGKNCTQYQRVARFIALSGVIVLIQDPVGQGERLSYIEPGLSSPMVPGSTRDHQYSGNQCIMAGDSPVRYFLGDAMRSIDYLLTRPEVDKEKIGLTGSSGGGTMTSHMMVCDKRVVAAAPGTFITTRQSYMYAGGAQDSEQIWLGGTEYGFDHHELLMCFAPKPVLILAVESDFFPREGTEEVYIECKRFWEIYEKDEDLRLFIDDSQHAFTDNLAREAGKFFAKVLNGEDREVETVSHLKEPDLNCTETGQVKTAFKDAKFIFDENLERYKEKEKVSKEWLLERVMYKRNPVNFNIRKFTPIFENGLKIQPLMWFSQKHMPCFGLMFRDINLSEEKIPVTICVWDEGTNDLENNIRKIREICLAGRAVFVVDLAGMGKCTPSKLNEGAGVLEDYGVLDTLNKYLQFMGDSICAMRIYDLKRTVDMLSTLPSVGEISIYGKGIASVYVRAAQILYDNIEIHTEEEVCLNNFVSSKYYENYNIASITMTGIANCAILC